MNDKNDEKRKRIDRWNKPRGEKKKKPWKLRVSISVRKFKLQERVCLPGFFIFCIFFISFITFFHLLIRPVFKLEKPKNKPKRFGSKPLSKAPDSARSKSMHVSNEFCSLGSFNCS